MDNSVHLRYLITSEQDLQWGLTVNTVGRQSVAPGEHYPPQNHPTRYLFSTERGRILDEYQLLYLARGKGRFISASCRETSIGVDEGQMFMLFPGEWHSYRPDTRTGWDEYWIGFRGVSVDRRVEEGFFSPRHPVFSVGPHEEIVSLYLTAIETAIDQRLGFQQILAGIVDHLLGCCWAYDKRSSLDDTWAAQKINRAKMMISQGLSGRLSAEDIAAKLSMSYSGFRRMFKQHTGFPPNRYILELRMQRTKELLTNTDLSSREIAFRTGFENPDYFCTIFKNHTGTTPLRYREFTQGKVDKLNK